MHEELKKFATFLIKPLDNKKNKCYNRLIKGKEKRKKMDKYLNLYRLSLMPFGRGSRVTIDT